MPAIRSWLLAVGLLLSLAVLATHAVPSRQAGVVHATAALAAFHSIDPVLDANGDSVADVPEAVTGYDGKTRMK